MFPVLLLACRDKSQPTTEATPATLLRATVEAGSANSDAPLPALSGAADAPANDTPRTVMVHLFEWRWPDIALECENFLGPQGFAAVQVSPPQEHIVGGDNPWWIRYQPVSYQLESRSGTRAEFADMVARCGAVGVDVYVDAVINHMTGSDSGVGSGGSSYTHYNYPGLYSENDFHYCGRPNDDISNYGDRWEVQTCELSNLADLATDTPYVQERIADYLNDLVSLGVDGFRLDASKHMNTDDIAAILARVNGDPYVYQEVIDQGGEPITAAEYFQNGDVTEFRYSLDIGRMFRTGRLADLAEFGEAWGYMPSTEAIVFVDNHDNQRGHGGGGGVLTHKDGRLYELANIFMLAWPYGYPRIMSSYTFTNPDAGPPSDAAGNTAVIYSDAMPDCFDEWVCEHRWHPIAAMVAFHNVTADRFFVNDWWSNGNNQIAFGRGDAGFVVINREDTELSQTFQTGLPAGRYCNVIEGLQNEDGTCVATAVEVNDQRQATITVPPMSAVALHIGAVQP